MFSVGAPSTLGPSVSLVDWSQRPFSPPDSEEDAAGTLRGARRSDGSAFYLFRRSDTPSDSEADAPESDPSCFSELTELRTILATITVGTGTADDPKHRARPSLDSATKMFRESPSGFRSLPDLGLPLITIQETDEESCESPSSPADEIAQQTLARAHYSYTGIIEVPQSYEHGLGEIEGPYTKRRAKD